MAQPVLLAVDSDRDILTAIEHDLTRRFAADYRIVTADTPEGAFAELNADDHVAVVIAGQWLAGGTGVDFLNACHQLHPAAKRLILVAHGDILAGRAAVRAMALGQLDHYLNKPWGDAELELVSRSFGAAQPTTPRCGGCRFSARGREDCGPAVVGPLP